MIEENIVVLVAKSESTHSLRVDINDAHESAKFIKYLTDCLGNYIKDNQNKIEHYHIILNTASSTSFAPESSNNDK